VATVTASLPALSYIHQGTLGVSVLDCNKSAPSSWRGANGLVPVGPPRPTTELHVKNAVTIAVAISLVLGAAAAWGSCAVPHRVALGPASSASHP
jgi:hypothetical protein